MLSYLLCFLYSDTLSARLPYANMCVPHIHVLQTSIPYPIADNTLRTRRDTCFYVPPLKLGASFKSSSLHLE